MIVAYMKKQTQIMAILLACGCIIAIVGIYKFNYLADKSGYDVILNQAAIDLNGYKIAFSDTKNIYMMNPDGSQVEQLADTGPVSGYVSWGPEAEYVYYASAKGSQGTAWEAWRVHAETKEETKISDFGLDVRSLGVSPDNKTMAISVMTGNSNIGNNNNNLTQFSTNLYTIPMSIVEAKIASNQQIVIDDLTAIKYSPNEEQFWYEELSWNHDANDPILAYTKTWRYDEDDVSYTHVYTIRPDGSRDTLIAEHKDQPIWSIDSDRLSFLGLEYYEFVNSHTQQFHITGISKEVSGGSFSPNGGSYIIFEIGDRNRKAGIAQTSGDSNVGVPLKTKVDVYEPRWSPKPLSFIRVENDPNFTIVANNDGILPQYNRKVVVFGIDIYAVPAVADNKLLHAANVMAQYLDNDEDGIVDDQRVLDAMLEHKAFVVMWDKEQDLWNSFSRGREGQDLGNEETNPDYVSSGLTGPFDASLEEILHIINHAGHSHAYQDAFGQSADSKLARAMDIA